MADEEEGKVMEMAGRAVQLGWYPKDGRSREEILGPPLKRWEVRALVKPCLSHNRQVNLGKEGFPLQNITIYALNLYILLKLDE